jgi:phosphatidylglycerol:prolipoprotein diacylglycerol transferase
MLTNFFNHPYSYGVILTLAFIAALILLWHNLKRDGISFDKFLNISLIACIFSIGGARLLYILLFPEQFSTLRDYLAIHEGGLVYYGGFIGATVALIVYLRKSDLYMYLDALAPSLALGQAIGRLGCFSNHCCYGKITELCTYYRLPTDAQHLFRHPTQIYSFVFLFILAILLQSFHRSSLTQKSKGITAVIYLCAYTLFRFLVECLRGDNRGDTFTSLNLSISQLVSLIIFIISLTLAVNILRNRKNSDE